MLGLTSPPGSRILYSCWKILSLNTHPHTMRYKCKFTLTFKKPRSKHKIDCWVNRVYQTVRDWNALPDSLIASADGVGDGVAKFRVLVNDCHFDVSPVNNSDSDSGAFGYFLRVINWSVDNSAQQASNKNSNDIISRDQCIEHLTVCTNEFIPVE